MKLIVAIVRPEKLEAVRGALQEHNIWLMSVSQVVGYGHEPADTEIYRGTKVHVRRPKLRLEIAVDDGVVDAAVDAIVRAGATGDSGQVGDGKVFVTELQQCVRIRDGERGPAATGTAMANAALPTHLTPSPAAARARQSAVLLN